MNIAIINPRPVFTREDNEQLMAVCYEQGWSNNQQYITQYEASKVTGEMLLAANQSLRPCTSLDELKYFDGVKTIKGGTFAYCTCTSLTLPPCTAIDDGAFANMQGLETLVIPESVTTLGSGAEVGIASNSSITTVDIQAPITAFESWLFYNMPKLTTVTTAKKITDVGESAFRDCTAFSDASAYQKDDVVTIGSAAFYNTAVTGKVESLRDNKLIQGDVSTDLTRYAAIGSYAVKVDNGDTVTIGGSIAKIEAAAFYADTSTPVLGNIIFTSDSGLSDIYMESNCFRAATKAVTVAGESKPYILNTYGGTNRYILCAEADSVVVPDGTATLCTGSIRGSIKTLTLNSDLKKIEDLAIDTDSLESGFTVPDGCEAGTITSSSKWAQTITGTYLGANALIISDHTETGTYTVPDGVTAIKGYANSNAQCKVFNTNQVTNFYQQALTLMPNLVRVIIEADHIDGWAYPVLGNGEYNFNSFVIKNISDPQKFAIGGYTTDTEARGKIEYWMFDTNAADHPKIYVPDAAVDAYKADSYFKRYADYIKPLSELPEIE